MITDYSGHRRQHTQAAVPPGTDGQRTGDRMLEVQPKMNRSQAFEVVWTIVADVTIVSVIFVRGEAVREIGRRTPRKCAGLFNSALAQCPLYQSHRLRCLVIVVARQYDRRNAAPLPGSPNIEAGDSVRPVPL